MLEGAIANIEWEFIVQRWYGWSGGNYDGVSRGTAEVFTTLEDAQRRFVELGSPGKLGLTDLVIEVRPKKG